jgi:hypothetical protein
MTHAITQRTTLRKALDSQLDAVAQATNVVELHGVAISLDRAQRPYNARLLDLAGGCTCGAGQYALPLLLRQSEIASAQRRILERAQQEGQLLINAQQKTTHRLEALRAASTQTIGRATVARLAERFGGGPEVA